MFTSGLIVVAAAAAVVAPVQGTDPLTAKIDDSAAQRFAIVWRSSGGKPAAAQLQSQYLDKGGTGIEIFTPNRIVNASHLAATIATHPALYTDAIERCLPWVAQENAELRSVYLGLRGLFPTKPLPRIAIVVGANSSGGTAGPGMQVLGLEVVCRLAPTRPSFDAWMRDFFAHETVHTFQRDLSPEAKEDPLLAQALVEGVPDYISELVTGQVPEPDRDMWAQSREGWIWQRFQADAAIVRAGTDANGNLNPRAKIAFRRWFANAGSPPAGWPSELGYWVGMRIAESYVAASPEPHAALDQLLDPKDPAAIIRRSGYAPNAN